MEIADAFETVVEAWTFVADAISKTFEPLVEDATEATAWVAALLADCTFFVLDSVFVEVSVSSGSSFSEATFFAEPGCVETARLGSFVADPEFEVTLVAAAERPAAEVKFVPAAVVDFDANALVPFCPLGTLVPFAAGFGAFVTLTTAGAFVSDARVGSSGILTRESRVPLDEMWTSS